MTDISYEQRLKNLISMEFRNMKISTMDLDRELKIISNANMLSVICRNMVKLNYHSEEVRGNGDASFLILLVTELKRFEFVFGSVLHDLVIM